VHFVDFRTGETVKKIQVDDQPGLTPVVCQGGLYLTMTWGMLVRIDLNTYDMKAVQATVDMPSEPIIFNENIYFGTSEGELLCYDLDLNEVWRANVSGRISEPPVMVNGNWVLMTTSMDYFIEGGNLWFISGSSMQAGDLSGARNITLDKFPISISLVGDHLGIVLSKWFGITELRYYDGNGTPLWNHTLGTNVGASPLSKEYYGIASIATSDGEILTFGELKGQPVVGQDPDEDDHKTFFDSYLFYLSISLVLLIAVVVVVILLARKKRGQ